MVGSVEPSPLLVGDALADPDFATRPARAMFGIGSYIGVPIVLADGTFFGTLCALDPEPRTLTEQQTGLLVVLARLVATQLQLDSELRERRATEAALAVSEARKGAIVEAALDCVITMDQRGRITEFNPAAERTFGHRRDDVRVSR